MGIESILNSSQRVGMADANIGVQSRGAIDRTGGLSVGGTRTNIDTNPGAATPVGNGSFPANVTAGAAGDQLVNAAHVVYIGPTAQGNDYATLGAMLTSVVNRRSLTRTKKLIVIFNTGAAAAQTWDGSVTSTQVLFDCIEFVSVVGTVTITVQNAFFNNAVNVIVGDDVAMTVAAGAAIAAVFGPVVECLFVTGKDATVTHPDADGNISTGGGAADVAVFLGPSANVSAGTLASPGALSGAGDAQLFAPDGASGTFFDASLSRAIISNLTFAGTDFFTIRNGVMTNVSVNADAINLDAGGVGPQLVATNCTFVGAGGVSISIGGNAASAFDDNLILRECAFVGGGAPITMTNVNRPVGCSFTDFTLLSIVSSNFSPENCQFNDVGGDIVINSSAAGVGTMRSSGNLWQANRIDIGLDNGATAVVSPFGNFCSMCDTFFTTAGVVNVAGPESGTFQMTSARLVTGGFVAGVLLPVPARWDNEGVTNLIGVGNYTENLTGAGVSNVPNVTNV